MKKFVVVCWLLLGGSCPAAEVPPEPLAHKGEPILADDFQRAGLGEWKPLIGTFRIVDGVLKGEQTRADHGAVGRFYHPMKNVVIEFKFKLDGSTGFNAVLDDQKHKGSHAGHICRVSFTPKQIRLGDDKEGAMRNDLFEMRHDPARKAEADKLIAGRAAVVKQDVSAGAWHDVVIEVVGDRMRLVYDGRPIGYLQSPGIAHETKTSFHFTVNGPGVLFDDVRIWQAR